ncbi:MAG: 16S rRNA (guanine(966)-N(2))-methyltransferase RsmD [Kineosporiaceae bacterium]
MTRIIAGSAGGRRIQAPKGEATRPTSGRVREALFSGLESRGAVRGAKVLDLFSGSGALGLEAASRGASDVVLVDSSREAAEVARRNATTLSLTQVRVVLSSVQRYLGGNPPFLAGSPADLVLLDPPYVLSEGELADVLSAVTQSWLAPGGLVVVERSGRSPEPRWPAGLQRTDVRRYGETTLWYAAPPAE